MMIRCYCCVCGLFITIPEKFGGGRGRCPRCSSELRIPHPEHNIAKGMEDRVRYLTDIATEGRPAEDTMIISFEEGPSSRFVCENCGESFESLKLDNYKHGECPECSEICTDPSEKNVVFPRVTWENGQQIIDTGSEERNTREIADAIGDISLTFGTTISASAADSIARLQAQAEAETIEAMEKLGETPFPEEEDYVDQYEAVSFTRKVPVVPELSAEEKRKKQRERLKKAVEEASQKASLQTKSIPYEQARVFYEGLQDDATASVETIRNRIDDLRLTSKKLFKGASRAVETHIQIGKSEQNRLAEKIHNAEKNVENARKALAKATADHEKMCENAEYLKLDHETYIQKLHKEASKLKTEIDEALSDAKKEIDERKFMISKIVDSTNRNRNQLESNDQSTPSNELAIHLQEACEDLLRLISQQFLAVTEVDEKLDVLKRWNKSLDSQAIESAGDLPEARPEHANDRHSSPRPIHPPDVQDARLTSDADAGWYYIEGEKEKGPVPLETIRHMFIEQKLNAHSVLRKENTHLSGPATAFPELLIGFGIIHEAEDTENLMRKNSLSETLPKNINRMMAIFVILMLCTITHGVIQLFFNLLSGPVHMLIDVIIAACCLIALSISGFYLQINSHNLSGCPPRTRIVGSISSMGLGVCLIIAVSLAYLS